MKILICDKVSEDSKASLTEIGDVLDISQEKNKEEQLAKEIIDSTIIIVRSGTVVSEALINSSSKLSIIARVGVGIDNIDVKAASNKGVYVVNSASSNIISAAELTVGLILSVARNIVEANNSMKDGNWDRSKFVGIELFEKNLGLVGFGRVANLVAERMASFGMHIGVFDPFVNKVDKEYKHYKALDSLLKESDVVSLHLTKTPETLNLISKEKLDLLKPKAIFINTSRGGVVDEVALIQKKMRNEIYGFGLDVYKEEPPVFNDELNNSLGVKTPHIGASTIEAQSKSGIEIVENIKRILDGKIDIALNAKDVS